MADRLLPALPALLGGALLAVILFVPFVFHSYRRRGEVGFGPALLAFGFLVYGFALVAYTLFPVPRVDGAWCAANTAMSHPQLDPLRFLDDIAREQRTPGLRGLPANPAVQQVVFNVALFVPLGAYIRHYFRRGVVTAVLAGAAVSLLIEVTQVTGDWFLFPCPYRLFDVDDLLANGLGAGVGVLFAPLLHLLYGRHAALSPEAARPVTARRRLLGMLVDLAAVFLLGGVLTAALDLVLRYGFDVRPAELPWTAVAHSALDPGLPALLLLALPSLGRSRATLGQHAVRLRRTRPDGARPGARIVPALLSGGFGYCLLIGLAPFAPAAGGLANLLLLATLILALPRPHRGLSGLVAGLTVTDSRPGGGERGEVA
ncbi:VanZ family protein [Nonomuraea terrae]|uniref:VanZ family protein n=1 Tax=Nonomuraea terrae TaxID=2530383 RepID=A0A4R4ZHT1_9ACTN|nr:VanZ family protein [Nonomuraea terrae]TDD57264.1 VanZ family protein [Nonomuraea terrae]